MQAISKGLLQNACLRRQLHLQGVRPSGRTRRCGVLHSNRAAADDNPMKLMSIAMKPVAFPPFPLERIEELTALMGGEGSV